MTATTVLFVIAISLFIPYYIYMCIRRVHEGKCYIVMTFSRWSKGISGVDCYVIDPDGAVINVTANTKHFFWMWYGIQTIDEYDFTWVEGMEADRVGDNTVLWKKDDDGMVTVQRSERTKEHRIDFPYRIRINNTETGKKKQPNLPANAADVVENAKVDTLSAVKVHMTNIRLARFKNGGKAKWFEILQNIVQGTLEEVLGETIYADLGKIKGVQFQSALIDNTEPTQEKDGYRFKFFDTDPANSTKRIRRNRITVLERVNYELDFQMAGVQITSIMILDFDIDPKQFELQRAMEKQAISQIEKQTAENVAEAQRALYKVKVEAALSLLDKLAEKIKDLKQTQDATIVKKAEYLQNLKFLVQSGKEENDENLFDRIDINKILHSFLGNEMSDEFRDLIDAYDQKVSGKGGQS